MKKKYSPRPDCFSRSSLLREYFVCSLFMSNAVGPETRIVKVRKREKIRNRYNQAPHLTQDTNGKVTTSQLDVTNESQEISPFPAGGHKASATDVLLFSIYSERNNAIRGIDHQIDVIIFNSTKNHRVWLGNTIITNNRLTRGTSNQHTTAQNKSQTQSTHTQWEQHQATTLQ